MVGAAPEYLMELWLPVGSAVGRQCLRSASRGDLIVPRFLLQTFGHRAIAVSGPQIWNSLPLKIIDNRVTIIMFDCFRTEPESTFIQAVLSASVGHMVHMVSSVFYTSSTHWRI